jgi:uncharacterized cupredoxin-like copper-binding protein
LIAVGIVALAVGAAALIFARTDPRMGTMSPVAPLSSTPPGRTIAISATDQLRFSPDAFTARAGETVAFDISNPGPLPHEFTVGNVSVQQAHEQEMASGNAMEPSQDATFSVDVPAGQTTRLVYTFEQPGTQLFGCHVPGHYAAGMLGTITVTPT